MKPGVMTKESVRQAVQDLKDLMSKPQKQNCLCHFTAVLPSALPYQQKVEFNNMKSRIDKMVKKTIK